MSVLLFLFAFICLLPSVCAKSAAEVVVVFLFTALFLGAAITFGLTRLAPHVPYTVVVFGFGALFGVMLTPVASDNVLKQSESMWNNVDPDLILYMFLPALLFGEAMSLSMHHVRGAIVPAAVLAGPGALFGALLMACIAKGCLPYNWSWALCLIFGCILCATDPVAVVALLKSAGASYKLTYLVIGEALMNDGTALVLYNMLFTTVETHAEAPLTALSVFLYFLKVIFVSPLLGGAFGLASVFCLSLTTQRMSEADTTVQMAVTVCCAYLSFFVAEYMLEVSGVLACCSAALVLARFANPLILRPETLHSIWAAFEWIGNTLIFTLAGLIIGARTFSYMTPADIVFVFVIYIFTFIVRALTLWAATPVLRNPRYGKVITREEAVFATWGGLRGAVSMALALSFVHSTEQGKTSLSEQDSHRVFFLVGGVAALTLVVNATTSGLALQRLGLLDETSASPEHQVVLRYIRRRIKARVLQMLSQLRKMRRDRIDPVRLYHYCSVLREGPDGEGLPQEHHRGAQDELEQQEEEAREFAKRWSSDDGLLSELVQLAPTSPAPAQRKMTRSASSDSTRPQSHTFAAPVLGGEGPVVLSPLKPLKGALRRPLPSTPTSASTSASTSPPPAPLPHSPAGSPSGARTRSYSPLPHIAGSDDDEPKEEETQYGKERPLSSASGDLRPARRVSWSLSEAAAAAERAKAFSGTGEATSTLSNPCRAEEDRHRTLSTEKSPLHLAAAAAGARGGDVEEGGAGLGPEGNAEREEEDDPSLSPVLLRGTRRAFLEVVRMAYWRQVNSNQLPRKSTVALLLLGSVDVALETTGTPGLQDWDHIQPQFDYLYSVPDPEDPAVATAALPPPHSGTALGRVARGIRSYRDSQAVYLLTSFIDAHVYAQQRIAYCMGSTSSVDTPEQQVVVLESQALVEQARSRLAAIDVETVTKQVTKQTARWVIHEQQEATEQYLREGVVSAAEAEELLHEAEADLRRLGKVEWTDVALRTLGALCRASGSRRQALVRHSRRQKEAVGQLLKRAHRSLSRDRDLHERAGQQGDRQSDGRGHGRGHGALAHHADDGL